tara:strand:- start:2594 stop:3481 length:888 start_codon:yes stop_codon:yes gene_type:complete
MTNGIIMFALNGQAKNSSKESLEVDYVKMAIANAKNINHYMQNKNVALITDKAGKEYIDKLDYTHYFTHINIIHPKYDGVGPNTNAVVNTRAMRTGNDTIRFPWQNQSRPDAYDLSPFDNTILLDCDYFVFDNTLDSVFATEKNILCGKHVAEISHQDSLIDYDRLHHQTVKLFWATVLFFKKSKEAELMFNIMKMIKKNWQYYGRLYKFDHSRTYRNDFAVSIALHIMQGKKETKEYDLPITLSCLADKNIMPNTKHFYYRYKDGWAGTGAIKHNTHVMNKISAMHIAQEILDE